MKLELAAAVLRRWGGSGDASGGGGGYRSALRAGGGRAREGEEGVDLLVACTVGLLVAASVILLDRWLKKTTTDQPAALDRSPRESSPRSPGSRTNRNASPRGHLEKQRSAFDDLTSLVFGEVKKQEVPENPADEPQQREPLTKSDVREELLALSSQDLLWVLKEVAHARGDDVLVEAMKPHSTRASRRNSRSTTPDSSEIRFLVEKETLVETEPQMRFSSFQYYVEEGEELTVRVVRVGDLSERSVVPYRTKDATAKAVLNYVPLRGELIFEPGEHTKELKVQIKENDFYGPSLELTMELFAEGMENARLDKDLWTARVEIMDNDFFPTNIYEEIIEPESLVKDASALKDLDQTRLLWEFTKFCMVDSTISRGMAKMVMTDQLENFYGFVNLIMTVYLVDYVVVSSVPESSLFISHNREVSLVVVTACLVLPLFGLHLLNYLRHFWGVSGRARTTMQTALLRKFLDYSEDVRAEVTHGDIILATTQDSFELVEGGLLKTLVFVKQLGAVFMLMLFQFVAPSLFNRPFRLWLLGCVCMVPALMAVVAKTRFTKSSVCLERRYDSALQLTSMVHETVVCYPLIADYNRRPVFIEKFGRLIEQHNQEVINVGCVLANNAYIACWITTLAVATFTFFGGMLVINGSMTLGMFLANIRIFRDVGDTSQEVYRVWLDMQEVLPSLVRITRLLNLPIDIDERKALSDLREKLSRDKLKGLPSEDRTEAMQSMPITIQDINIGTHTGDGPIKMSGRVTINPGNLVAVIGPRSSGKSTFLKILGGAILPNPEDFFIPSHLTVLHVQPEPLFFSGTLMDNLLFGYNDAHDAAAKSRVIRICTRLGLSRDVLSKIKSPDALHWSSVLSFSQRALINLARALIANPNVLIIHRPTDYLDEAAQSAIMAVLHEFVEKRGIEQDEVLNPIALRPPHTCILSTASFPCIDMADEVICVSKTDGIRNVHRSDVTENMLR